MSDPEYNAARRAKGLRAVTQGLNINLDLEVAIVCLNHAADKIEELERERDDALRKLESLEESITSLDHPNIRILLRQAESYALDVAEKHEKRYCEIKKQLADSNVHLENITIERDSERALADRLGNALEKIPWTFAGREEQASEEWNALAAWKEARSEA